MKKSFIVIGLGRFGSNVAKTLAQMNCDVLAVDVKEDSVDEIKNIVPHCLIADATKKDVLEQLGAKSIDHAVVAIGNNLEATVLTLINLKKLGVRLITVRADEESHKDLYYQLGATDVIVPEEQSAIYLANQIQSDSILDYYEVSDDYVMVQNRVGENFVSKTLIELNIRKKFDVNIVGFIDQDGKFFIPSGTDKLMPGAIVVVVGKKKNLKKFDEFLNN